MSGWPGPMPDPPTSPPPDTPPIYPTGTRMVACVGAYTYVWPKEGSPFWFVPAYVYKFIAPGYRWTGQNWVMDTLDLNKLDGVVCSVVP